MKNKILVVLTLLTSTFCFSQKEITWYDLSKVKFEEKYFPDVDDTFLHPTFLPSVKELEGKLISVTGFFLNIDPKGKIYILSKGPMASCFFCGVGGPETAIELEFDTKQKFRTDTIVTVTGVLKLNDTDIKHFNYILTKCKVKIL